MKKLLVVPVVLFVVACNNADRDTDGSEMNSEGNVEQYSGENISPQLDNESDSRFDVDTMNDPNDVNRGQQEELQ